MNSCHLSHRFGPRWRFPATYTIEEELPGPPSAGPRPATRGPRDDQAARDFDEALAQVASDPCTTFPVCGALVDRDGNAVDY